MKIDLEDDYFSTHLITYLGNKRRLLPFINQGIELVKGELGQEKITALDGFAGSGAVSRLLKFHTTRLEVNDFEAYADTVNRAFLTNRDDVDLTGLAAAIDYLNAHKFDQTKSDYFISKNYAPAGEKIKKGERVFYTPENAKIIDNIRYLIDQEIDPDLRLYCLAELIVKASIHNNTSGVFKGFHKKDGIGHYGGRGENALARIKQEISLDLPIFPDTDNITNVYCRDTNELIEEIDPVDLAYYDPPYNQHPYGSNYFMLNIINGGKPVAIQDGVSGISEDWQRSDYNKAAPAERAIADLLEKTPAKFILVSYNNEGIVPFDRFKKIIKSCGSYQLLEEDYNAYRGSRNLHKRSNRVKELLWLIEKS